MRRRPLGRLEAEREEERGHMEQITILLFHAYKAILGLRLTPKLRGHKTHGA